MTDVKQIQAFVRARDGMRCVRCEMTNAAHYAAHGRALQVHRKHASGPYTLAGCETLCVACHGLERRGQPRASNYGRPQGLQDIDILLIELVSGGRTMRGLARLAARKGTNVAREAVRILRKYFRGKV